MQKYVVTIARGFGSGGKEIGVKLAQRLGIPCYEHQILQMASESSGINESLFNLVDEKVTISDKFKGVPFNYVVRPSDKRFTSNANLFNIQSEIIRKLATETSFIVIGKCADYVLKDFCNVASFYIEAPRADCVASIIKKMGVTEPEAHRLITKTDKYRADYYKHYTNGNYWTNPVNYDMTLNSARVGRDRCVDVMENYVKAKFGL
jgi:predicted nucleic acid-binding Zn finger protein